MALFQRYTPLPNAAGGAGGYTLLLVLVQGGESFAKCDQSVPLVGELTTETAAGNHGSGWEMCEADSALGNVLMLSSLATGAKHVDAALPEKFRVGLGNRNPGML